MFKIYLPWNEYYYREFFGVVHYPRYRRLLMPDGSIKIEKNPEKIRIELDRPYKENKRK